MTGRFCIQFFCDLQQIHHLLLSQGQLKITCFLGLILEQMCPASFHLPKPFRRSGTPGSSHRGSGHELPVAIGVDGRWLLPSYPAEWEVALAGSSGALTIPGRASIGQAQGHDPQLGTSAAGQKVLTDAGVRLRTLPASPHGRLCPCIPHGCRAVSRVHVGLKTQNDTHHTCGLCNSNKPNRNGCISVARS